MCYNQQNISLNEQQTLKVRNEVEAGFKDLFMDFDVKIIIIFYNY